jgi:methylated-DNA-[protein]-cysteine S-methyltransferase
MAQAHSYTLFATAIGRCAVAWNDIGLTGIWLPAAEGADLRRQVLRRAPRAHAAPPVGAMAHVVEALARLVAGESVDFAGVVLDLADVEPFDRRVYRAARAIAPGHVLTYGDLAARVGDGATAREVGRSLGRNRWPLVVPCHRIVASGNGLGGFSAPGGTVTKRRLLAIEGARRGGAPDLFDAPVSEITRAASGRESGH